MRPTATDIDHDAVSILRRQAKFLQSGLKKQHHLLERTVVDMEVCVNIAELSVRIGRRATHDGGEELRLMFNEAAYVDAGKIGRETLRPEDTIIEAEDKPRDGRRTAQPRIKRFYFWLPTAPGSYNLIR